MRSDAVVLPPSSTSPFDRVAEWPEVEIEPLFVEPQGSLPHTSSCGVDHTSYHAWNGHPTSLPAYNNLTSEWSQAGIVGAAGFNGYAQPSITCATHVQVPDVYSSADVGDAAAVPHIIPPPGDRAKPGVPASDAVRGKGRNPGKPATSATNNITRPVIFNSRADEVPVVAKDVRGTTAASTSSRPLEIVHRRGYLRATQSGRGAGTLASRRLLPQTTSHPL